MVVRDRLDATILPDSVCYYTSFLLYSSKSCFILPCLFSIPGFLLEMENELPDVCFIQTVHADGQPVLLEKDAELFQAYIVPPDGPRALSFRLAGDFKPLDEILKIKKTAVHIGLLLKNQIDINLSNQIDNSAEANKKSASLRPIPAILASKIELSEP